MKLQLKRSNVIASGAAKIPTAAQLEYGELAINYNQQDPAIFLKDSNNNVIRIGGIGNIADDGQVELPTTTNPPTSPTPLNGNLWYNSQDGRLYVYYVDANSSQWVDASPDSWQSTVVPDITDPAYQSGTLDDRYINISGDTLTGALLLDNAATVATPDLAFDGDLNTGIYSPGADSLAITTAGTQRVVVNSIGSVGIGTATPAGNLEISATNPNLRLTSSLASAASSSISFGPAGEGAIYYSGTSNHFLGFSTNSTEKLRIDSAGNVGIGTTSPGRTLDVNGVIRSDGTSGALAFGGNSSTPSEGAAIHRPASNTLAFATDSTERLRIDSSGNLTFSQSASSSYPEQKLKWSNDSTTANGFYISQDSGRNGRIFHEQGLDILFGTNNTERMRINSSGKVGIGTTAPDHVLHLSSTNTYLAISDSQDSGGGGILFRRTDNGQNRGMIQYNFSSDFMSFRTSTDGNGERMRIDSSGNVGIGLSNPIRPLDVNSGSASTYIRLTNDTTGTANGDGFEIFVRSTDSEVGLIQRENAALFFRTNDTERLRIDSSGKVIVSSTTFTNHNNAQFLAVANGSHSPMATFIPSTASYTNIHFRNPNGNVGSIATSGSATSYNTSSDYRLKENVINIANGITRIKQLSPKRFNFIADADKTVDGFLAHEAQTVVPEAVTGTHNEVDDDGNAVMQGIDQSKLVPLLTAALQEAIAKIETLEQRLTDAGIA